MTEIQQPQFLTQSADDFFATPTDPDDGGEDDTETHREWFRSSLAALGPLPQYPSINHPLMMPLERIASALEDSLASAAEQAGETVEAQVYNDLSQAYDDVEAKLRDAYELIEQIEAMLKPSSAKLSLAAKDAITAWKAPQRYATGLQEPSAGGQPIDEGSSSPEVAVGDAEVGAAPPAELHPETEVADGGHGGSRGDLDVHNHEWGRTSDGVRACACGAWIDTSNGEPGVVRNPVPAGEPS